MLLIDFSQYCNSIMNVIGRIDCLRFRTQFSLFSVIFCIILYSFFLYSLGSEREILGCLLNICVIEVVCIR